MEELIEQAREHIRSYGYNGFANHTVMPTLMAEFAKIYHKQQLQLGGVVGQSEKLIAFCEHLNTYNGMEEIRFDFMMQDFIDKSK